MGSVNQARMLALARRISRPLSSERRSSFLLRLTFVMPTAEPLEVHRAVIITWLDVVTFGTSCRAARPVMQQRFAPAACAGTDEGAALFPIIRQASRTVRRVPCHARPSQPVCTGPRSTGADGSGGQYKCADTV